MSGGVNWLQVSAASDICLPGSRIWTWLVALLTGPATFRPWHRYVPVSAAVTDDIRSRDPRLRQRRRHTRTLRIIISARF